MFFRKKKNKTGFCLQLVESFRDNEDRPRQHVLLSLGMCNIPENLWSTIASEVENKLKGIFSLIPNSQEVQSWVDQIVAKLERRDTVSHMASKNNVTSTIEIDPKHISHHDTRELGPSLVGLHAWNALGMSDLLTTLGFNGRQKNRAIISVLSRLIDPCSEYSIPSWVRGTALGDILENNVDDVNEDQFYRIADKLYSHKKTIETHLSSKEEDLFQSKRTILLYDVTNTYFEGVLQTNPKAKRGHSKEKRNDAPLLAVGLVLDMNGFAIRHEIFPGNTADSTTLLSMIEQLGEKKKNDALVVVDSGIASEENLLLLKEHGYHYIVAGKRPTRLTYLKEFQELEFATISGRKGKPPVSIAWKDINEDRLVFCKSEQRQAKEEAIFSNAEARYLEQLKKLSQNISKGRLIDVNKIFRALGRLAAKNPRVARYYETNIVTQNDKPVLTYHRKDEQVNKEDELFGCYYLRCSRKDMSEEDIWRIYMMLTKVEASFRALKSHLGLRPIYHYREDRCDSHIFISILAYHLLHWIEFTLQQHNDIRSWPTIRRTLQTHAYTTIVAPSNDGRVHHIRTAGVADAQQQRIYEILGVNEVTLPRYHSIV